MRPLAQINIETSESVDINLSPLIDMVFLLLIFFMVTTVFVQETGVTVQRPRAASARTLEKNSILLALTESGEVMYGGRQIGINGVRGVVARLLRERDLPVIILADATSRTGLAVRVMDECRLAGATKVSLAARRR
ncbi:MAG: biopolymer transporter ExbD [Kiritimatiellaeota bacterium]|nr:biopolymer transporter ExbD [Kiritimatiellota bacterium]